MGLYVGSTKYKPIVDGVGYKVVRKLPYDAEVEYLQSSGTQYIQIPLSVSKNSYFEVGGVVIALHPNDDKNSIFGASPDDQFRCTFYSHNSNLGYNTFGSIVGNASTNGGWGAYIGQKTPFALSTTFVKYPNVERALSRPLTANITAFRIFASYANNNRYPIKFCEFYIKVDDAKVYDLISVRKGTVGYMYDKVSGQLFGNAGTGSFILGNDKN